MTPNDIARSVVWKNSFAYKRQRRERLYRSLGFLLFAGLVVGAAVGMVKILR